MPNDNDMYGYDKMSATELRDVVVKLTREVLKLKEEKKDFNDSINDVLKDNNNRIKTAIEMLDKCKATDDVLQIGSVDAVELKAKVSA